MTPQQIIQNYINGNLTEAKQGAKRYDRNELTLAARDELSCPVHVGVAIAEYLKNQTQDSFQRACDLEQEWRDNVAEQRRL